MLTAPHTLWTASHPRLGERTPLVDLFVPVRPLLLDEYIPDGFGMTPFVPHRLSFAALSRHSAARFSGVRGSCRSLTVARFNTQFTSVGGGLNGLLIAVSDNHSGNPSVPGEPDPLSPLSLVQFLVSLGFFLLLYPSSPISCCTTGQRSRCPASHSSGCRLVPEGS